MTELESLSVEIKKKVTSNVTNKNRRRYPPKLKFKILNAALKYGDLLVSRHTDIPRGTLCNWRKKVSGKFANSPKKTPSKYRPIIINELPHEAKVMSWPNQTCMAPTPTATGESSLKLTLNSGVVVEVDCKNNQVLLSVIDFIISRGEK